MYDIRSLLGYGVFSLLFTWSLLLQTQACCKHRLQLPFWARQHMFMRNAHVQYALVNCLFVSFYVNAVTVWLLPWAGGVLWRYLFTVAHYNAMFESPIHSDSQWFWSTTAHRMCQAVWKVPKLGWALGWAKRRRRSIGAVTQLRKTHVSLI